VACGGEGWVSELGCHAELPFCEADKGSAQVQVRGWGFRMGVELT
jgi:hypothetical protein